jgi:histidinol-phosphate aminotransferase
VAAMRAEGILVRDRSADPGCQGFVRITIGTPDQMRPALAAVKGFLESQPVGEHV